MKRFHDWPTRLSNFFDTCSGKEFGYGVFDCWIFIADAILWTTGEDIIFKFDRNYESEAEAGVLIRERIPNSEHIPVQAAFDLVVAQIAKELKLKEVAKGYGQRGDIALMDSMFSDCLGIVDLSGKEVVCPHPLRGLMRMPINHGYKFWSFR